MGEGREEIDLLWAKRKSILRAEGVGVGGRWGVGGVVLSDYLADPWLTLKKYILPRMNVPARWYGEKSEIIV